MVTASAQAVDKVIGQDDTALLTCILPTQYQDNSPIVAEDTITVDWYVSTTPGGPYSQITGPDICSFTLDLTSYNEGNYYFVTVVHSSLYNTYSANSNEVEVRRIAPLVPKAPTLSVE